MITSPVRSEIVSSFIALLMILGGALSPSTAVSQERERPKLKDFGSSLKQLKWDHERNAAVETKPKPATARPSEEDNVVRVETSLVVCDVLVLDSRGQIVQGLTEKDFVLSEDGKPQQVDMFSLGDNVAVPRSKTSSSLCESEAPPGTLLTRHPGNISAAAPSTARFWLHCERCSMKKTSGPSSSFKQMEMKRLFFVIRSRFDRSLLICLKICGRKRSGRFLAGKKICAISSENSA